MVVAVIMPMAPMVDYMAAEAAAAAGQITLVRAAAVAMARMASLLLVMTPCLNRPASIRSFTLLPAS